MHNETTENGNELRNDNIRNVYDSGIFDYMVGSKKEMGDPPKILNDFFQRDIEFILNELDRGGEVLEVGCGSGRLLKSLVEVSKHVTGIDFSKKQIEKAKAQMAGCQNVDLILMDAQKMEFQNGTFDHVLCLNCSFGNMPDIESKVMSEMSRVTRTGGKIALRVFLDKEEVRIAQHENYKRLGFSGIRDEGSTVITNEGFYSRRFTREEIEKLFLALDLKAQVVEDCEAGLLATAIKIQ